MHLISLAEDELKIELQGVQYSSVSNATKQNSVEDMEAGGESLPDFQQIAEDAANISKVVMPRKKMRLYEAMQLKRHGINQYTISQRVLLSANSFVNEQYPIKVIPNK
ncbi:unnamed protein product [Ilex paraguariensis]|uniref:Uncharacterized protein n=1 Tax=Ilex paraguariensis TaxID=185542 RepID=A0ABC8QSI8_9AQUA